MEQKAIKKRNRGINKKIGFSEEKITRNIAENLLSQEVSKNNSDANTFRDKLEAEECANGTSEIRLIKAKKRKLKKPKETNRMKDTKDDINQKKKKRKGEIASEVTEKSEEAEGMEVKKTEKSLSGRAVKRLKHQQLLEKKKKESEIGAQQKALNYLSKWKYLKSEWKFEKIRQVWLVQNLYNSNKLDDKFFSISVEYFTDSKGKIRSQIQSEAEKIIEDEKTELEDPAKFQRAKDIIQNIQ